MHLRILSLDGDHDSPAGEATVDARADDPALRAAVLRAIQAFREAEHERRQPPAPMTLQVRARGMARWAAVNVDAGTPPPYTPVRIDTPFEIDWPALLGLLRLTHRYWRTRLRLRQRARSRRGEPV